MASDPKNEKTKPCNHMIQKNSRELIVRQVNENIPNDEVSCEPVGQPQQQFQQPLGQMVNPYDICTMEFQQQFVFDPVELLKKRGIVRKARSSGLHPDSHVVQSAEIQTSDRSDDESQKGTEHSDDWLPEYDERDAERSDVIYDYDEQESENFMRRRRQTEAKKSRQNHPEVASDEIRVSIESDAPPSKDVTASESGTSSVNSSSSGSLTTSTDLSGSVKDSVDSGASSVDWQPGYDERDAERSDVIDDYDEQESENFMRRRRQTEAKKSRHPEVASDETHISIESDAPPSKDVTASESGTSSVNSSSSGSLTTSTDLSGSVKDSVDSGASSVDWQPGYDERDAERSDVIEDYDEQESENFMERRRQTEVKKSRHPEVASDETRVSIESNAPPSPQKDMTASESGTSSVDPTSTTTPTDSSGPVRDSTGSGSTSAPSAPESKNKDGKKSSSPKEDDEGNYPGKVSAPSDPKNSGSPGPNTSGPTPDDSKDPKADKKTEKCDPTDDKSYVASQYCGQPGENTSALSSKSGTSSVDPTSMTTPTDSSGPVKDSTGSGTTSAPSAPEYKDKDGKKSSSPKKDDKRNDPGNDSSDPKDSGSSGPKAPNSQQIIVKLDQLKLQKAPLNRNGILSKCSKCEDSIMNGDIRVVCNKRFQHFACYIDGFEGVQGNLDKILEELCIGAPYNLSAKIAKDNHGL